MKKNIVLVLAAIMVCLITAPQIFSLESAPAAPLAADSMDFEAYMASMPEKEISDCDMTELELQYESILAAEEAGQQQEANKQLDDLCFKISTYAYAN